MTPPLSPERLTRLLHDAVRPVTARPGAFDRIRRGVRRRRATRRTGVVLLAAAVVAGGAFLVFTPGGGPARIGSLSSSPAKAIGSSGHARTTALPSPGQQAPTAAQGAPPSAAQSAPPSPPQSALPSVGRSAPPSVSQSAPPSVSQSAPPSVSPSAPPSASQSPLAPFSPSPPPSASQPAEAPAAGWSGTWAIDGFGQPAARVTIVPAGDAQTTFSFLLVARTARYGTQTVPFTATSVKDMPPNGPVIVGTADAAKDGHTELFVMVDAGCCTQFWTIFRLVGGHIAQVSMSGAPVRLSVGGSVMLNFGFSCTGPYLVTYSYSAQVPGAANLTFLGTRDTYRWVGASLVLISKRHATIRGLTNPELAKYSGVSCGGLPQYELHR